jgi:hypothetical protein
MGKPRGPVRVSPDSVDYRRARPLSAERCVACSMYLPSPAIVKGSCTLVTGPISGGAVCDRFASRVRVGL